ncbi:allene oxide synthase-like [Macadamia integrifolia]|uniref:allene oxide synthase-like n=1 Tax=Macadamia integrifolia TaxID=60698 RepID=UPI001C4F4063|nr:allene oxide synthase-like [Macadamia integrifolia]XP_042485208.1 allene oxide synthase-like [Macadamia integrifolia]
MIKSTINPSMLPLLCESVTLKPTQVSSYSHFTNNLYSKANKMSTSFSHKHKPSKVESPNSELLHLREIPGSYGLPFVGAIRDRIAYFYTQGKDEFFRSRIQNYHSTVFRTNMPPGPFLASDPKVIVLLDAKSFSVLLDVSKVEKKNVLDGTFMPSTSYTGGYRVCAYLDPSEPKHALLKRFFFSILSSRHKLFIPEFRSTLSDELFPLLEDQISKNGKANFNTLSDSMSFSFVFRLFCDKNPSVTKIGSEGPTLVGKWLFFQLAPLITFGSTKKILNLIEDLLLHTFPLPSFLVKSDYNKLYDAFSDSASQILDEAEAMGLKRDEACHNLVFLAGFNAFGGMKTLFPALIKWVGLAGEKLHKQLAREIRTVAESEGGVTFSAIEKMTLTKSVVYEALRIEPPVPFQYGKAKQDLVIESHEAAFRVKKGEMIFGYQPFATKDPKVFEDPEEFVGSRFVGEGEKLLKYVYWSNGRETESPTEENKQCPAKDLVVLVSRLMLVEFFLRYDTFTVEVGKVMLGSSVTVKSLTPAKSCS